MCLGLHLSVSESPFLLGHFLYSSLGDFDVFFLEIYADEKGAAP